jgi:hypothetical protein
MWISAVTELAQVGTLTMFDEAARSEITLIGVTNCAAGS